MLEAIIVVASQLADDDMTPEDKKRDDSINSDFVFVNSPMKGDFIYGISSEFSSFANFQILGALF